MEFSVALMLILLGVLSLAGVTQRVTGMLTPGGGPTGDVHAHPHTHSDYVHTHPHGHAPSPHGHADTETPLGRVERMFGSLGVYQLVRPLVVGIVHGLAGSAAVALLVLAAIRDPLWAVGYLLLFGVGTVAGMMVITAVIGLPLAYTANRFSTMHRYLGVASGLLSLGFGLFLAYQIGLGDGLFTSNPQWVPK
jgi:high-affinity nickel-transport protein